SLEEQKANWLLDQLEVMTPQDKPLTYGYLKDSFEKEFEAFEPFWYSKELQVLRELGLLVL
ncbi:MAG: hypothetical protein NWQ19_09630, partial [Nonlabens sp.]|nr:hypothetical protein [Nonlabens sp.]